MTGLGLLMFLLAFALNHYRPHNQGIADITHGSIYQRFVAHQSSSTPATASFSYVNLLPKVEPKTAAKMADPTSTSNQPLSNAKTLPTMTLAGGKEDPNVTAANEASTKQPADHTDNSADTASPAQADQAQTSGDSASQP